MKFYNMVIRHLSIISLFSCFTGAVASQALQKPKTPELLCVGISRVQVSYGQNNQMEEETEESGRSMLDDTFTKSADLEAFRKKQVKKQQDYRERLQQEELEQRKALEETRKQLAEQERLEAERKKKADALNYLALGQILESSGFFGTALENYRYAAELGNDQAVRYFDGLRKQLAYLASCANASYKFGLKCEQGGNLGVAIGLYEQAAKCGSREAVERLQQIEKMASLKNNKTLQDEDSQVKS